MDDILQYLISKGHITQEEFDQRVLVLSQELELNPMGINKKVKDLTEKVYIKNPDEIYKAIDLKNISLEDIKTKKINQLNFLCNQTILSTFTSACLGVSHIYSFSSDSQMNFSGTLGAINANISPTTINWKTEDAGVLSHTITQFKSLFADGMTFKQANINKYRSLKDQVLACTTQSQIDAIVW